jgi:hypothetical protein
LLGKPVTDKLALVIKSKRGSRTIDIELEYYDEMLKPNVLADLDKQFRTDREFFDHHKELDRGSTKCVFGRSDVPRNQQGYVQSSIVRAIRVGGERRLGNVLKEPGLGTVYFGEMLTNSIHRRIILIRLEMGSNPKGRVTVAGPESNGGLD